MAAIYGLRTGYFIQPKSSRADPSIPVTLKPKKGYRKKPKSSIKTNSLPGIKTPSSDSVEDSFPPDPVLDTAVKLSLQDSNCDGSLPSKKERQSCYNITRVVKRPWG